jgi:hypothetical protein
MDRSMSQHHALKCTYAFRNHGISRFAGWTSSREHAATMAKSVEPFTWEKGFQEPSTGTPWVYECASDDDDDDDGYTVAPSVEVVTSEAHNELGINVLRTWPTIYDGTNNPHGVPEWWSPASEVDVVICGGTSPCVCRPPREAHDMQRDPVGSKSHSAW